MDKEKEMKNENIQILKDFVNIQSVSTDPKRFDEILKAVDFLTTRLKGMDFEVKVVSKNNTPPLIIASRFVSKQAETVGIYGHYDVQPEDPIAEWDTKPFDLTLRNGKFYGRGVADDKGHVVQNLAAIHELIQLGQLKKNIMFILEGEEEVGSLHFEEYVKRVRELLSKVDVFFVIDVGMRDRKTPQIFYGLRGLLYCELRVQTGERDLHSGVYGNRVLNPAQILSSVLAAMKDEKTGKVLIPYFYDNLRKLSKEELIFLQKTIREENEERKEACVYKIVSFDDIHPSLVTKIMPSLEINGLCSGYIGEGSKTIIPSYAFAKLSCRLVEHQDPDKIENLLKTFIKEKMPEGVKYEFKVLEKSPPFYTNINNTYMQRAARLLAQSFQSETFFNRSGASIGAAEVLQRIFKKPIVLTGFTLPDENIHAPNENFDEELFFKGIKVLRKVYNEV